MKYSPMRFARDFPPEKRKKETLACLYCFRPLSYLFSSAFASVGIGPNLTSLISLVFSLTSCALLVANHYYEHLAFPIVSFVCFFLWLILDCVDGNLARTVRKERYGDFFDAIAGYIYPGFYLTAFGLNASGHDDLLFGSNTSWIFVVTAFAGVGMITLLLCNKKFLENQAMYVVNGTAPKKDNSIVKIIRRVWSELSFGGFMPIIFLFAFIFRFETTICLLYSVIFMLVSLGGLCYLILKAIRANRHRGDNRTSEDVGDPNAG